MALVSGRPISLRMDLYNPLYLPRPVGEPERFAALRPPTYDGGFGKNRVELASKAEDAAPAKAMLGRAGAPREAAGAAEKPLAGTRARGLAEMRDGAESYSLQLGVQP